MVKSTDRIIDKLKLKNLNIENLKKIIEFEPQPSQSWSINDQLVAIDLLGYTASEEALTYLQKLYKPSVVVKQSIDWADQEGVSTQETNLIQHYNYPNARGPLAKALHYEIPLFEGSKYHLKRLKPAKDLEIEKRTIYEKSIAHGTIVIALDRLRQSIAVPQE